MKAVRHSALLPEVRGPPSAASIARIDGGEFVPERLQVGVGVPSLHCTRCGIRGVIWYQREANAGRHAQYAELSKLMIADWRNRWGQGDFPFLLVQLAGFEPGANTWAI